jgi:hypothetical protein
MRQRGPCGRRDDWRRFAGELAAAERAAAVAEGGFAFAFQEGALVRALRSGAWLLLDEVNLAPPEVRPGASGPPPGRCAPRAVLVPMPPA